MNELARVQDRAVRPVVENDHAAIEHLLDEECAAYLARDFERWAKCWVHDAHVRRWGFFGARGVYEWVGWEEQAERVRLFIAANPAPSSAVVLRDAENLHIGNNVAWMTFDESSSGGSGPLLDIAEHSAQMRVLEKESDGWKIAFACKFHRSIDHVTSALMRVDRRGAVLWMNPAAEVELRARRGIVVRAGRVRAADPAADQRLQAAIAWAGETDDGIWQRRGTLPVMLASGHGEPASMCCVIARDSQILVSINDQRTIDERIAVAGAVFGITPAQRRLAGLIVGGYDLVHAAARLGISANTARTQLRRMFQKTGVRSQPSLVGALLSVTASLE